MEKCPYCAEEIQDEAVVCRHCGRDLTTAAPPTTAPVPPAPQQAQVTHEAPAYQRTNGFAIASLVLGILWIYGIASILALIFGYIGKKQVGASGGTERGRGLAVAGIVLGWIGVVGTILLFFLILANAGSGSYYG